jgi:hypothetical protein
MFKYSLSQLFQLRPPSWAEPSQCLHQLKPMSAVHCHPLFSALTWQSRIFTNTSSFYSLRLSSERLGEVVFLLKKYVLPLTIFKYIMSVSLRGNLRSNAPSSLVCVIKDTRVIHLSIVVFSRFTISKPLLSVPVPSFVPSSSPSSGLPVP